MAADVSVVVPSFQQGPFLERCLASVRGQLDVDVEFIVIDACSSDSTTAVLEAWAPRIEHLVVEPDDGQADGIRKGMALATAPVLTWLNADDAYAGPAALATLLRGLDRRPDADVAYGRRVWIDGGGRFLRLDRWQPFDATALRQACFLPQEAAVFRRTALDRVGGIDTSLRFAIDYDLWLRMLDAGSRFLSLPPVVGLFRVHADQKTTAAWVDVGLVEIRQLHERHLGRAVPEPEMMAVADAHRDGTSVDDGPATIALRRDVAAILNGHLSAVLRGRVLDRWALEPAAAG